MIKVYISGAITGVARKEYERNFERAERHVTSLGMEAVNPLKIGAEEEGMSWEWYMAKDIPELMKCDAILLMHGWEQSNGARLERAIARRQGLLVMEEQESGIIEVR